MNNIYKYQRRIMKHLGVWKEFKANRISPHKRHSLAIAFVWGDTSQGFDYWDDIANKMMDYLELIEVVAIYSSQAARYLKKDMFKELDARDISITGHLTDVMPWHLTSLDYNGQIWSEICGLIPNKHY